VPRALLLGASTSAACGYTSLRAPALGQPGYCIEGSDDPVVDPDARAALEDGVRTELTRRDAVAACFRANRVVVRLLHTDSLPVAMVAAEGGRDVLARGQRVRVEAAARVRQADGTERSFWAEHDVSVAHGPQPLLQAVSVRAARAEAAWRCGAVLARRILGEPVATPER
jgi:hypothetical protein